MNNCLCLLFTSCPAEVQCHRYTLPHECKIKERGPGNLAKAICIRNFPPSRATVLPPDLITFTCCPSEASQILGRPAASWSIPSKSSCSRVWKWLLSREVLYTTESIFPLSVSFSLTVYLSSRDSFVEIFAASVLREVAPIVSCILSFIFSTA